MDDGEVWRFDGVEDFCSVGDSARSEAAATNRINQRKIDIDFKVKGKRPTLNAERPNIERSHSV